MKINYLLATWSGSRYTKCNDYLKVHLKRLFELKHSLDQITVIRPLGSDNDDFYDVGDEILLKIVILNRPDNDRSYGQFVYAYQQYTDKFDYYIIVEDDYIPNIDNFDSILVNLIEKKQCDYLCGKYATQRRNDPLRAIHNQGIVKASAFKHILSKVDPKFPKMGPEDGTEQIIFSKYFTDNGLTIKDYADEYSVPFWSKTLHYFSKKRGFNTIFVPYQCIVDNIDAHFLSSIQYKAFNKKDTAFLLEVTRHWAQVYDENVFIIVEPGINLLYPYENEEIKLGYFKLFRDECNALNIECFIHPNYLNNNYYDIIIKRIAWENRSEKLFIIPNKNISC